MIENQEQKLKGFKPEVHEEEQINQSEERSEVKTLKEQLEQCKIEQADWKERAFRLTADLENYKKRMTKEQSYWMQRAQANILQDVLPIVDNFDRAMEHIKDNEGMAMIHTSLHDFLKNAGVQEVSYTHFDPIYHEALMHVESEDYTSGQIVQVLEKGYQVGEHVLRPAKVSVAK
jgi:molecular chaperone GrpE